MIRMQFKATLSNVQIRFFDKSNNAANIADGDQLTNFSAKGEDWVGFDFCRPVNISKFRIFVVVMEILFSQDWSILYIIGIIILATYQYQNSE